MTDESTRVRGFGYGQPGRSPWSPGVPALRDGGNVVTNDLHFGGSLRHLIGLREHGVDVRILPSVGWQTDLDAMADAIDDDMAR